MTIGKANSYGAITVLNALLCGKGATISIPLRTKVEVRLFKENGSWLCCLNGREYSSPLAISSCLTALEFSKMNMHFKSGEIRVISDVPIGVGLKSSSSLSVAAILATFDAIGYERFNVNDVLRISAKASILTGVSITGAHDDAASCLLGGFNVTDNLKGRLLISKRVKRKYVVLAIPREKSRRFLLDKKKIPSFKRLGMTLYKILLENNLWDTMTLNGFVVSAMLGYKSKVTQLALEMGAVSSGLSGTGPAVASLFEKRKEAIRFESCLNDSYDKKITEINNRGAFHFDN